MVLICLINLDQGADIDKALCWLQYSGGTRKLSCLAEVGFGITNISGNIYLSVQIARHSL